MNEMKEFRNKYRLSQARAAEVLGVPSRVQISQWERGVHKPPEIVRRYILLLNYIPYEQGQELLALVDTRNGWLD